MKGKLSALVEVRKLIALVVICLFVALSLLGRLEVNFIQTVIIAIISFYYGKTTNSNDGNP